MAAKAALAEHAATLDPGALVEDGLLPGTFRLRRALDPPPPVTLVILTGDPVKRLPGRGDVRLLPNLLSGLAQGTTYPDARILVVDDGGLCPISAEAVAAAGGVARTFSDPLRPEQGFSFARKANFAVGLVDTEYFVLLNDDLEVTSPGWLEALLEPLMDAKVAVAGARLLYPDGRVQHAGIVIGVNGGAAHVFHGMAGRLRWARRLHPHHPQLFGRDRSGVRVPQEHL